MTAKWIETKISPAEFERLQVELFKAENAGHSPDDCVRIALNAVGLSHAPRKLAVDYLLHTEGSD